MFNRSHLLIENICACASSECGGGGAAAAASETSGKFENIKCKKKLGVFYFQECSSRQATPPCRSGPYVMYVRYVANWPRKSSSPSGFSIIDNPVPVCEAIQFSKIRNN